MNAVEEQRIATAKAELRRIQDAVNANSNDWERHLTAARSIIISVDSTSLMQRTTRADDQEWIISTLQRLAYYDPDSGGVQDIAQWCVSQWLRLLQYDAESVAALQGMRPTPLILTDAHTGILTLTKVLVRGGYHARKALLLEFTARKAVRRAA